MQRIVSASGDTPLKFVVERDGKTVELDATPERRRSRPPFGVSRVGVLGVSRRRRGAQNWRQQNYSLPMRGARGRPGKPGTWSRAPEPISAASSSAANPPINCPARSASPKSPARWPSPASGRCSIWSRFCRSRSACSTSLPVPLLDGGHLLYYAAEALRGRALTARAQEIGFRFGMAFVAGADADRHLQRHRATDPAVAESGLSAFCRER